MPIRSKASLPLRNISNRAEAHEEHGAMIEMEAIARSNDDLQKLSPSPGTSVIAKVRVRPRAKRICVLS